MRLQGEKMGGSKKKKKKKKKNKKLGPGVAKMKTSQKEKKTLEKEITG